MMSRVRLVSAGGSESIGFKVTRLSDGTEVGLLEGREGYADALDPANWKVVRMLPGTRAGNVIESVHEGKQVFIVTKPQRTVGEVEGRHFDVRVFPPDVARNLQKAEFIRRERYYEDDEIVVRFETPSRRRWVL
jgi:hypothetical protein